MLPEDCISSIVSLTTPQDASRFSLVSSGFRSLADSDFIWDRFLPAGCPEILGRALNSFNFSSKKELYFCLCNPTLIDAGTKMIHLDKSSGKICYTLSARELSIEWSSDPMCWSWKSVSESRFPEVAELITISWLEIHGKIKSKELSKKTVYGAYLIIKVCNRAFGLDVIPSEVSVEVGGVQVCATTAYLCTHDSNNHKMEGLMYGNRRTSAGDGRRPPRQRADGWLEIEVGEFFNGGGGGGDEEVRMSVKEVKGYQLKGGIVIQGIEFRPNH